MKLSDITKKIFLLANVVVLLILPSCTKDGNGYDIKKTWTVQNVLALNGDKWIGAPQEMSDKFGTTWTFSDEIITIDRQIVKYKLEDDIIILENGDSFKIISLTENDLQLGSPVTKATVYIIFKSESRYRQ